jgi:hypothetical protein
LLLKDVAAGDDTQGESLRKYCGFPPKSGTGN